jgi:putative transposase
MRVQRAYQTELDLNDRQVTACKQHAGAARWAYNWGLQLKQKRYQATGKSPTAIDLHRELNALKKTDVPWLYQVSKCAPQEALRNLDAAFAHYFRRCALKRHGKGKGKLGYPRFKTKKQGLGTFRLTGRIVVSDKAIVLPRLGRLRLKERGYLPTGGGEVHLRSATVSEQAGHWSVSLQVEQEQMVPQNTGPVVGIDLGVKALATFSDGEVIPNPRHLRRRLKQLKRRQRVVSRRQKGGKNGTKAVRRLAKLHRADRESTAEYAASGHHQAGENQVGAGDRRPACSRDAAEPSSGASHRRCGVRGVQAAAALQSQLVWSPGHPGGSLGAVQQAL